MFAKPAYTKRTPFFSVLAGKGEQPNARLGIVVGKRNVKLAVERNKLKRLVRESFRIQQQFLGGLDIVVVIKKNFVHDVQPVDLSSVFKLVGSRVQKGETSAAKNNPKNINSCNTNL